MRRYNVLTSPLKLPNGVWLKNRMVHPKCCPDQIQGPEEWPTEQFINFHREAARRGNSLVVLCDAFRPEVRKMPAEHDFSHSYSFDLNNPAVHNYLCSLADDVHYYGSKVIVSVAVKLPMGASVGGGSVPYMQTDKGFIPMPPSRAATKEEMDAAINATVERTLMYKEWGYDGVALGGVGLDRSLDVRDDEYGGTTEKRCKFMLDTCRAIKKACGEKFIVHVMMYGESLHGPGGSLEEGHTAEDTAVLAKLAQKEGLIDLMTIREGTMVSNHPTGYTFSPGEHPCVNVIKRMKAAGVTIPLAAAGGFQEPDEMEALLAAGDCDLISIGRGLFTDPDYYTKVIEGRGEDIRPCLRCNRCHGRRRAPWTSVCAASPDFGRELKTKNMVSPVTRKKKVAVIGGGPAGMQAALTAAERGHTVTLFEKTDYLGGQLRHADYFDFKWPFKNYRLWFIRQLEKKGVEIKLNTEILPDELAVMEFDAVIAATGAKAKVPYIEGMRDTKGNPIVKTCHDVIGHESELGKNLVMVGCSETGIETACYLAQNGHNVTCLTRQNQLAKDASPLHSITIAWIKHDKETGHVYMAPYWERFDNLKGITEATTVRVTPNSVTYVDKDGIENTLACDDVVVCGGIEPCIDEAMAYYSAANEFYVVGDADGAGDMPCSIRSGFAAASRI